jgi:hypothetical protein
MSRSRFARQPRRSPQSKDSSRSKFTSGGRQQPFVGRIDAKAGQLAEVSQIFEISSASFANAMDAIPNQEAPPIRWRNGAATSPSTNALTGWTKLHRPDQTAIPDETYEN